MRVCSRARVHQMLITMRVSVPSMHRFIYRSHLYTTKRIQPDAKNTHTYTDIWHNQINVLHCGSSNMLLGLFLMNDQHSTESMTIWRSNHAIFNISKQACVIDVF